MKKWITGVLASITGGLILWFLTQSNTSPLKSGPDLKITEFHIEEPVYVGERTYAEITVYNAGSTTAEACRLSWYPKSTYLSTQHDAEGSFGVPPQQSSKARAWIEFQEAGEILTTYGIMGCTSGISPEAQSWFPEKKVLVLARN